jgi:hypothetical protein
MAVRYIPRKTHVKTEFVYGITGNDLFWLGGGGLITFLLFVSGSGAIGIVFGILVALATLFGILRAKDRERMYTKVWLWFKFLAYVKRYSKTGHSAKSMRDIIPYDKLESKFIFFGTYYGAVIEIYPIEFGLLDIEKQEAVINALANAFRRVSEKQTVSIINMDRGMVLDRYIDNEIAKYNTVVRNMESGALTEEELSARDSIFIDRGALLEHMNEDMRIFRNNFFMVVYDKDRVMLESTVQGIMGTLSSGGIQIQSRRIEGKELAVFLRGTYNKNFDERDVREITDEKLIDWISPSKIEFSSSKISIAGVPYQGLTITGYPLEVDNAWAYTLFNMNGCRTVLNFHLIDKVTAEKTIDKAIIELKTQKFNSKKSSYQIESDTQLQTITDLLTQVKRGNEQVYDCTFHLIAEWDQRKEIKALLKEEGFSFSEMFGRQIDTFRSANISRLDVTDDYLRGIPTTTLAACFPFISDMMQDENGICIGSNSYPVFVDFFKRDSVRVNSNMIVIGKSGSGKSFATKTMLLHFAADNTKIFILDPEREYTKMTAELHGNFIDVGNAGKGRFNPFHIYPAMFDDDESGSEFDDTYEAHLRFLESFFKIIMEGLRTDTLELLNGLVSMMYRSKGIDRYTDFTQLQPEHFPTFQDLFELCKKYLANAHDDFARINYRMLVSYLEKFASGGRYSGLWNGPASIRTGENFVTFNFMTLFANKNNIVADAQMLLTFKYLDGEIIQNREYNMKHGTKRKIIIVVDEAHVFISEQRPIALDFMFNMAKRIRKYDGMQIIITQNIKDFVGSPAIAKKSAAIINASQYSMIFALAPNDLTDLVTLYKSSGGINKSEQVQITNNARGQCFFISGPMNRTLINIETSEVMRAMFEE